MEHNHLIEVKERLKIKDMPPINQPQDFSIPKSNTQPFENIPMTSTALQLDRYNVLNVYQERHDDELIQADENVVSSINANLEVILEEGFEPLSSTVRLWRSTPSYPTCIGEGKSISNGAIRTPTSDEDEFTTLQQQQNPYMNRQILPSMWDAGCNLTIPNIHTIEKIQQHSDMMVNTNRATYLGSDGWRSISPETNQLASNEDEYRLTILSQNSHTCPNYTDLPSILGTGGNRSTNPYFYSILDEELTSLPGGTKRWRYLMRDLIRNDPNIMRPDRWRFLINELKQAHPNVVRNQNIPTYLVNYLDRSLSNDPIQTTTSSKEKR